MNYCPDWVTLNTQKNRKNINDKNGLLFAADSADSNGALRYYGRYLDVLWLLTAVVWQRKLFWYLQIRLAINRMKKKTAIETENFMLLCCLLCLLLVGVVGICFGCPCFVMACAHEMCLLYAYTTIATSKTTKCHLNRITSDW